MTVTLGAGSFNFGAPLHGTLKESPWDQPVVTQSFFGIIGEQHLVGKAQGRDLELEIMLYNGADEETLRTVTNGIGAQQGLSGTLTINSLTWLNVRFVGFFPSEAPFVDGSGQSGWCVRGTLRFRQIAG